MADSGEGVKNQENDLYLSERKSLIEAQLQSYISLDKWLLTLSGGAFGLSITFIKNIIPSEGSKVILVLFLAWLSFCLSLLSTLISFSTSQTAYSKQIEIIENDLEDNSNTYRNWTIFLNKFSVICFIVGVFSLAIFCSVNLYK